jgi:hypothetical protein
MNTQLPAVSDLLAEMNRAPQRLKTGQKVRRNRLCPCGGGKKFKDCHSPQAVEIEVSQSRYKFEPPGELVEAAANWQPHPFSDLPLPVEVTQ